MKQLLIALLISIIIVLFQVGFFPQILFFGVTPNLILVAAFCLIYFGGIRTGFWLAFFGGIFLDVETSGRLGFSSLLLVGLTFVISLIADFLGRNPFIFTLAVFLLTLVFRLISSPDLPFSICLKEAVLSTAFLLVLYYPFKLLRSFFSQKSYIQLKMKY
ncbi:hypothetical protein COY33_00250 [candidate division WWE3 bacterium CG_4_10_14_0_2_um_filter_42_7]|uniref:Rod shape-determining protein MreD n=2 Tax=Katanobacteria TaxID=422282 RepID=A0A2H0XAT6_UNCKA|nr:MAG: hypothetical protein COT51_03945 [candidate division WWE3 bacterium CG08_land_8_20_14_0_20_41_15]PIZ44108.1 MAG: hypothetical protein COY33_00250 [candidate division WWE3 bacterium CG_4_10_14_0_2_um_filter_42_7]